MIVKQKIPTFETLQWTGSNQSDCEDFINERVTFEAITYSRIEEPPDNVNTLIARGTSYFSLFVPLDCHIIYGPSDLRQVVGMREDVVGGD